jgi:hypothetical protein
MLGISGHFFRIPFRKAKEQEILERDTVACTGIALASAFKLNADGSQKDYW